MTVRKYPFATAYSSHGELIFRADTGDAVANVRYNAADPESLFLCCIERVDVREWNEHYQEHMKDGASVDILDVGYWSKKGDKHGYEPPEADFRRELKEKTE